MKTYSEDVVVNTIAELSDFSELQQEEMVASTIMMLVNDRERMRDYGHADCLACRTKLSVIDQTISELKAMFHDE
jgi:hypothetical protein